jgi:rhamnogalacturonyl hydrolase YesR
MRVSIHVKQVVLAAFLITCTFFTAESFAKSLPSKDSVMAKMVLVNKHFMQQWSTAGCATCLTGSRASSIWTRATYFEGLLALYNTKPDTACYNYAVRWGTFHNWNLRDNNATTTNADNQCAMQPYIDLYKLDTTQTARLTYVTTCMNNMITSTAVNYWTWIDAIQMAMPGLAKYGVLKNDTRFFDRMYALYNYPKTTLKCYDTATHLWFRDANFVPPVAAAYKTPNGLNCYWSRGNGWVIGALVRVLDVLPANDAHRAEYVTVIQEMAAALKKIQRADGFWNVDLGDSTNYGGPEMTGTGFFAYGIAWGINHKILDSATYIPVVTKAWNAIADNCVHPLTDNAILGYAQGSGDRPSSSQPVSYSTIPDFPDYPVGIFLLAGSEVYKLAPLIASGVAEQTPAQAGIRPNMQIKNNVLTIANAGASAVTVSLLDLQGRLACKKNYIGCAGINLKSLVRSGTYLVHVERAGRTILIDRIVLAN